MSTHVSSRLFMSLHVPSCLFVGRRRGRAAEEVGKTQAGWRGVGRHGGGEVLELRGVWGWAVARGFMAKNGQSLYVQEMCAPFHGIMHQKKFGSRPMSGR